MSKSTLPAGITAEDIAAFMASKKADEAKKTAAKDSKSNDGLAFHICTITGGRKYDTGTKVKCLWSGKNKFKADTARILFENGEAGWINPKFLKAIKPMDEAEVARLKAENEADSDETILVPASVGQERDKAVLLNYTGWFAGSFFPKSMVTKVGETKDGLGVFEIPAWKVRKDKGPDALEALRNKQDAIKASIIEA